LTAPVIAKGALYIYFYHSLCD